MRQEISMTKPILSAFFCSLIVLATNQCIAQTQKNPAKSEASASKTSTKHASSAKTVDNDEDDLDPLQSRVLEYKCELGNTLTIYSNIDDENHIAIRWKKKLNQLTRVETSTGAHRFENRRAGLVWIGIPAKGLLLDSIRGKQLANECKTSEQE
jgi:hypothetical protein